MSDYRDDRPALRDRIRVLEGELERTRGELSEAQAEIESLKERAAEADSLFQENARLSVSLKKLERKKKGPQNPMKVMGPVMVVGIVLAGGAVPLMALCSGRSSSKASTPKVALPPKAKAKPTATPQPPPKPPATRSSSCRCPAGDAGAEQVLTVAANGSMSFGGDRTYFAEFAMDDETTAVSLAAARETVPPSRVEGGKLHMLMACAADRVVFAQGQRITAWDLQTGDALWNTTLPEPVGSSVNGALSAECSAIAVKKGRVMVPTPGGTLSVSLEDGSRKP